MKKKTLLTSIASIAMCASLVGGATFALFTDESNVNIAVTSGKVDVEATAENFKTYSGVWNDATGVYDSVEQAAMTFSNGGKVTSEDNTIIVDRITPMDKVTFDLRIENNSNVTVKYQTVVMVVEGYELFSGLDVTIGGYGYYGTDKASDWVTLAPESEDIIVPVSIELPEDAGNAYQDLTTKLSYAVNVVQGNANTGDSTLTKKAVTDATTLSDAIAAATENDVIVLENDIDVAANVLAISNKTVNIDLNGHKISSVSTITGANSSVISVGTGATLNISNGVVEMSATTDMAWNNCTETIYIGGTGVVNMENVFVKNLGGTSMAYAVDFTNGNGCTLNADNCRFEATYCGVRVFNNMKNAYIVNIKNSVLTGKSMAFWVQYGLDDGRTQEDLDKLQINIYNNGNVFKTTKDMIAPITYGFDSYTYYNEDGTIAGHKVYENDQIESVLKETNEEKLNVILGEDLIVDVTAWSEEAFGGASTKEIVIDGNGQTITFNQLNSDWNNIATNGAKLIIKNAHITSSGHNNGPWNRHDLNFACDVELENVTSDKALAFKAGATLRNVTINDANTSDTYAIWIQPNGQTIDIDGLTVDMLACSDGRGIKIDEQYVAAPEKVTLIVKNATFKTEEKSAILVKSKAGAEIHLSNVDISGVVADSTNEVWVDEASAAYSTKVKVVGGSKFVEGTEVFEAATSTELKTLLTNNTDAGSGDNVIKLTTSNLDMTSTNWTPIVVAGYTGAGVITLDGNGCTITGLNAPLFKGGFAGNSGIVIKNLTIADSNIVSTNTLGSGAFIESVDSMQSITLENCHLKNSTVTGGDGSRTGGLIGWTAGYDNVNDGPVKTYVTITNCSVVECTITCNGSVGGIYGHAGNNAWTYSVVENCTVKDCNLNSTNTSDWRVGVVVGTANVGEMTINNITESGNTLTQTGKTAPAGQSNLYGRFVPGTTGKLVINGVAI